MTDIVMDKGCEICGALPVKLSPKCHIGAPLDVQMHEDGTLKFFCSVCGKYVTEFEVKKDN